MLDLDPIKKRLAMATQRPWRAEQFRDEDPNPLHHNVGEGCWSVLADDDTSICDVTDAPEEDNARLIASAPDDMAALVAEVESLRAWKASALAVQMPADDRLRPLVQDVPGAMGRNIYEVAADEIERLRRILGCFDHMGGGMALSPSPTPADYRAKGELIYDLATGLVTPEQYEAGGGSRASAR